MRDTLAALFAKHTKAELYQAAIEHLLFVAPLYTVADIRADEQLASRGYFVDADQGERGPGRLGGTVGPAVGHAADDDATSAPRR